MPRLEDIIKERLTESDIEVVVGETPSNEHQALNTASRGVMSAYQNANRWLDTIKEDILINKGCPYFSNIVHQLAHTMPGRFDRFGDILHTKNLLIPYPATEEWRNALPDMPSVFKAIYEILDQIQIELIAFKKCAEECSLLSMSIECDQLITDIASEYEFYYRIEKMLEYCGGNLTQWDKRVYEYWNNKSKLI